MRLERIYTSPRDKENEILDTHKAESNVDNDSSDFGSNTEE